MVLLSILALGMLSLSTVALRSTGNHSNDSVARANARLALSLAIAELQKHAGPDQRVTGRADLLDESVANPMWTAVWNSSGGEPAYLVSGNEQLGIDLETKPSAHPAGYFKPDSSLGGSVSMELFGMALPSDKRVRAPLVEIKGERDGAYAYWVSDEGVKARFNRENPFKTGNPFADKQLASGISQKDSTRYASDDLKSKWPATLPNASRVVSISQGQLVAPDEEDFAIKYFHDLTPYSRGLLTDVKKGGLKRDLTLAFENEDVFERWFGRRQQSERRGIVVTEGGYTQQGSPEKFFISDAFWRTSGQEVGPNWGTMCHYYNIHKKTGSPFLDPIFPHPAAGIQLRKTDWNPYTKFVDLSHGDVGEASDLQHTNNFLSPVPCRVQLGYRLAAVADSSVLEGYNIELEFKPLVGLWNPYNVTFRPNVYKFDWEMAPIVEIEISGNTIPGVTQENANGTMIVNLTDWFGKESKSQYFSLESQDVADIQPGEFRMFSVTKRDRMQARLFQQGEAVQTTGVLVPTWGADGYFRMALPEQFTQPVKGAAYKRLRVSKDAQLKIKSLALSEQRFGTNTNTDGNFMTMKPGWKGSRQGLVSNYRSTNFWQPGVAGVTPEPVEDLPPRTAQLLSSSPQEIGTWAFSLRSTKASPGQNIRSLIDSNVRAANLNSRWDGSVNGEGMTTISPFRGEGDLGRGLLPAGGGEPQTDGSGRYHMFGGDGNQTHVVTFDLPHSRPLSLGQFQHAVLARYCNEPSFVLGNSYANIRVPLDKKINTDFLGGPGAGGLVTYDTSYLVNENVWDGYFLSGLSPDDAALPPESFKEMAMNLRPAPNSRIAILNQNQEKADLINPTDAKASDEIAGKLAVEGAFNVNSTSVAAWRAVLAGMDDLELPVFDPYSNGATTWKKTGGVTFSRFSKNPGDADNFWMGYTALDDVQIDALAREMVNQVRARGPFRNLGDFVNRSLTEAPPSYSGSDIRESGAIQAALDAESSKINSGLPAGVSDEAADLTGNQFLKIISGKPQATGSAGFVMQGDVLQAIAPIITVRSDTFVIRTYGNAKDKDENITAQAWCEAVVQRVPNPYDPTGTLNDPNPPFGRKFEIVAFRWLNKNEI